MEKNAPSFYKPFLSHLLFWSVYVLYAIGLSYLINPGTFALGTLLKNHFSAISLFYLFYLVVLPNFNSKRTYVLGVLLIPLAFVVFVVLSLLLKGELHNFPASVFAPSNRREILTRILIFNEYFIYALGYWFAIRFVNKEIEKQQVEQEKLLIEIKYLKAQVNPHFLYNTLSYFYTKVLPHDGEVADGIASLTDIMRYSLETSTDKDGLVRVDSEIEQIDNLIKINQLRYDQRLAIDFSIKGALEGYRIMPHLLITLVENAFKHGDTLDPEHPLTIFLEVAGKRLNFSVVNKKRKGAKELSTNIGLANIRNRLQFIYGERYHFEVTDGDDSFRAQVTLFDSE